MFRPFACSALVLAVAPVVASAQGDKPQVQPQAPAYTIVRFDENYRSLANAPDADPFDPIKYIPIGDDPDWYLSLGGQGRYRYEYFDNFNFGAGPQDGDGYHLLRLIANADLHLGENLRGFVMLKSAQEWDRTGGPRITDEDELDIDQAFVDLTLPVGDASVTIRPGRQYLLYGAQRLISPLDWVNTRRTFDGGKAIVTWNAEHATDAFWVRPVIVDQGPLNESDDDADFAGVYHTWKIEQSRRFEPYALNLNDETPNFPGVSGDEERYTLGARYAATEGNWSYDLEADYQFGEIGDDDISAWSFATEVAYQFVDCPVKPRPFIGFDIASGDDDPTDGDLETFNQLFPLGHAYFGYIDVIGRQNIIDVHPGVTVTLKKDVTLRTAYHLFWRQSDEDAVYNAAGGITRADGGSDESYVGSELDFLLTWQVDRHLNIYAGYSHFFAGDFIDETGADEDIDFVYVAATYTF